MSKWMLKQTTVNIDELALSTGLHPVLVRLLAVRGLHTKEEIEKFLAPEEHDLDNPFLFKDMDKAVQTAIDAINNQTKCAIFGDYDADGIMSTVILYKTFKKLGLDITYYIPSRDTEGYGMNTDAISFLAQNGIKLIFACDNGINAFEQIKFANDHGIKVVILDHHAVTMQTEEIQSLPEAYAVVDAKRIDCSYPFKYYCAAGLCYRFSQALFTALQADWSSLSMELLHMAAIATICDLVELYGDNRKLVKMGLRTIHETTNPGIKALINATNLNDKQLNTHHIGFILGPCINAAGRLETANIATQLFLTDTQEDAENLANKLVSLNHQRRELTEQGAKDAIEIIEKENLANDKIIVIFSQTIRESVAGIIAGRLKEHYNRPAIVLVEHNDQVRGSCRSVDDINIYDLLCMCKDLIISFGGHPMAAGLSIEKNNIEKFREQINDVCTLDKSNFMPTFRIDSILLPSQATLNLAYQIQRLSPFGKSNEQPLFAIKNLTVKQVTLIGKEQQFIKWYLEQDNGFTFEAIDFNTKSRLYDYIISTYEEKSWYQLLAGKLTPKLKIDIIYQLNINTFRKRQTAQIQLIDFRPA